MDDRREISENRRARERRREERREKRRQRRREWDERSDKEFLQHHREFEEPRVEEKPADKKIGVDELAAIKLVGWCIFGFILFMWLLSAFL